MRPVHVHAIATLGVAAVVLVPAAAGAAPEPFEYDPPGVLVPGSGQGRVD